MDRQSIAPQILQITLLGTVRFTYGNTVLTNLNSDRLRSLLSYLVLNSGKPLPRSRLASLFWPDSTDTQARTNLRRELHYLRQILPNGDQFLQVDSKVLWWRSTAPFTLDVVEFEQAVAQAESAEQSADFKTVRMALERATVLYQGDLLPDCSDEWILPEKERLRQIYSRVLQWLVRLLKRQGEIHPAMRYAQRWLQVDALNEAAYCELMHLSALSGDRAGALHLYYRCMTTLRDELGIDPSPTIRALYDRLLNQGDSEEVPAWSAERSTTLQPSLPLVGRDREFTALRQWLATADKTTAANLLLLTGEAGIGKTRLLEALATEVNAANGQVLWGCGFAAEMRRPYGAWIDALRSVRDWCHPLSELSLRLSQEGTGQNGASDRAQLFDAVVDGLAQMASERSLTVVILDDIQWLDAASIALLHYAIRLLPHTSIRFVCAARLQELTANLAALTFIQALQQRQQTLELGLLQRSHLSQLAQTVQAEIDADQLFLASGGNPLFALEIVDAVRCRIPYSDRLQGLIRARLQQLSQPACDLLPWAAALGQSFNPTIVAQAIECPLTALLTGLEDLEHQGIIRPSATSADEIGYVFVHDVVRQVVYQQLSEPRRRLMHAQIARILTTLSAHDPTLARDVAYHVCLSRATSQQDTTDFTGARILLEQSWNGPQAERINSQTSEVGIL